MIELAAVRKLALSFPGAEELPHFHLVSFRLYNKIFATLWVKEDRAMLKLSLVDQSAFCSIDGEAFRPVPGGWGARGATFVELGKVRKDMLKDAITTAYRRVASKKKRGSVKSKAGKRKSPTP